jgi:hypothetical protein
MFELIFESILEPLFLTTGVLFVRLFTLGKYPSTEIKEKYKIIFESFGFIIIIGFGVLLIYLFF